MNSFARQFLKKICPYFAMKFFQKITLNETPHLTLKADAMQHLPLSLKADGILGGAECIVKIVS
jgi:hypothetical protein